MKKILILALASLPLTMTAQSAFDVMQLAQYQDRGTARFMSMGGAFTALGGDPSVLNQNPAGLGVYTASEISATLDVNFQSTQSSFNGTKESQNITRAACNNASYIGTARFGSVSPLRSFSWGFSYGRVASLDRRYHGSTTDSHGSLTNAVAAATAAAGWTTGDLSAYGSFDPFNQGRAPWMSIMLFNSYGINPSGDSATDYEGLYNGTPGAKSFYVDQKGYIDEYNFNFGGNIMNIVYWGLGFGIVDVNYQNTTYYGESFADATIANSRADGRTTGSADLGYTSFKSMSGTGYNFKLGVIIKPINEFRLGIAFHTPTYYNIDYDGWAATSYDYSSGISGEFPNYDTYGSDDYFSFQFRTPWRLMVGAAGIINRKAIVSVDYEYRPYQSMVVKDDNGDEYTDITGDVKNYYNATNIVRLGIEYRLSKSVSARLGYSYQSAPSTQEARESAVAIYTDGPDQTETQPSYTLDRSTRRISAGLGYHSGMFYADIAYINTYNRQQWNAYADNGYQPSARLTHSDNHLVLTMGLKF